MEFVTDFPGVISAFVAERVGLKKKTKMRTMRQAQKIVMRHGRFRTKSCPSSGRHDVEDNDSRTIILQ